MSGKRWISFRATAVAVAILAVGVVAYLAVTLPQRGPAGSDRVGADGPRSETVPSPRVVPQPSIALRPMSRAPETRAVSGAMVTLLVRSDPDGARVTVGGAFRGTTPLRLTGRPGQRLTLLLYKQDLTWLGTVLLNDRSEQTMDVVLTRPPGESPAREPTAATTSEFEIALRSGKELYTQGWYGPAAGQLKQATVLNPQSAEAYLWWARALTGVHRYAEARRAIETVLSLEKSGPLVDEATALLRQLP
jgi:tetratricopeptide (TPR) repeat protein